jgi:2-keto-4-pentenoate hydratase/2-oxohepta-3-ene-1,7-dioic acid hydratase in catechol pathway
MRLLMFLENDAPTLGVLHGEEIVSIPALAAARGREAPWRTILDLIDAGAASLEEVRVLLAGYADGGTAGVSHPLEGTTILAPLNPPRGNVVAIGRNYHEHAVESARARSEEVTRPTVFTKAQTSINGPYGDIPSHTDVTEQLDWEVELGVVIGTGGLGIARDEALQHVFGYTVINDISARDVQHNWGGQFFKGKSLDGSCPSGPWIVTADEVPDPQNLDLWLRVNGEPKQHANTSDMIFPVAEIIAQLSSGMTLPAGTLIATGTPAGVGMGATPPTYLKEGDVVEAGVDGIGTLRNRVVGS